MAICIESVKPAGTPCWMEPGCRDSLVLYFFPVFFRVASDYNNNKTQKLGYLKEKHNYIRLRVIVEWTPSYCVAVPRLPNRHIGGILLLVHTPTTDTFSIDPKTLSHSPPKGLPRKTEP